MNSAEMNIIIVVVLISLSICFLTFMVIRQSFQANREVKHILKHGVPAEATISSLRQTNIEINGHPEVYIGLTIPREHAEPYRTIIKAVIYIVNIPQYEPGRKVQVKMLEADGKIKVALEGVQVF
ncbi:hypothetical protein [Paenibacillus prosopidis]|nr:hypothetical protein [Paenibacillus prosopidis]